MNEEILFTGQFDASEIAKGINGMIDALKRAQDQGTVSAETLNKMQGAIDRAVVSANNLRDATGKPIAFSLNDGKITQQLDALKKNVTDMSSTVSKKVQEARDKLASLVAVQEKYKNDIKEINGAIAANTKEFNQLEKQLNKLIATEQGGSKEAAALRTQISGLSASTAGFKTELVAAQSGLAQTTAAVKIQNVAVKETENAGNKFAKGLTTAYSGLRKLAYIIPGVGIAGLISMISGPLVDAFEEWTASMKKAYDQEQLLKDSIAGAGSQYQKAVVEVTTLSNEIDLAKQGFLNKDEVVKHYNETIGKTTGFVKDLNEAEQGLVKNAQAYVQMTLYKAAANIALESAAKKAFEAQQIIRQKDEEFENAADRSNNFNIRSEKEAKNAADQIKKNEQERKNARIKAATDEEAALKKIGEDFNKAAAQIATGFHFNFFGDNKPDKVKKARKEVENIYEQELQKLKADIAKLDEKGFTDETTITAAIEADFKKRDLAFQKAFKNKQLTAGQLASLQDNLKNLQQLTLDKGLKDFATQKAAYLKQISDELDSLQNDESLNRISTIQDSFERERQTIISETDKTVSALQAKRDKTIADILKNAGKNGLTEKDLQPQIDSIKNTYARLLDDLDLIKVQKLQKLSFDTFTKLKEDANTVFSAGNLGISQGSLIKIQDATNLYQSGKISYKKYQQDLTKIARDEEKQRFLDLKQHLEDEIALNQKQIDTGIGIDGNKITPEQKDSLIKQNISLNQQLTDATKGDTITNSGNQNSDFDKKIEQFTQYANAIGQLTQSVISFWQQANDAEQKALDRSIALQDRRVAAAQQVAAKGNAEYLRLEEEKAQKLQIQQENAARRTMAINAALQGSQILVALISGIAQGAKEGGAIGTIIEVAAIVAAIAGAYAIAQSFKAPQPSFYVGTEDTGHGGNLDDKGGFHAVLHPHERVLTAEENKKLKGLSNKEVVERVERTKFFMENYKVKPAPSLNVAAMEMATNHAAKAESMKILGMEENNRKLDENNVLQKRILTALKSMGVDVKLDERGMTVMVMKVSEDINKSKSK